ncbi:hypothetical protein E5C33_06320 [Stenotrophomonas maltophilia]|nr:hypothetical protein E5C33_06320 [Stenotrophomonas maltophilia]
MATASATNGDDPHPHRRTPSGSGRSSRAARLRALPDAVSPSPASIKDNDHRAAPAWTGPARHRGAGAYSRAESKPRSCSGVPMPHRRRLALTALALACLLSAIASAATP